MTTAATGPAAPGAEPLAFLQEAVAASAALAAADRLGVLARLASGPVAPATLARDCAIGERGTHALLAALAGLGVLEAAEEGGYRAASAAPAELGRLLAAWGHLGEAVRAGRPLVSVDTPGGAEAFYPSVVRDLAALLAPAAERAADHLAAPDLRVLDAGAGAAPWSLALATRDPACRVTAVDLPAVLPATRRAVAAAGRATQFRYLAGDFFTLDWGHGGYDLALAGNLCHLFDEGANRRLLGRLSDALRPGGRLAIIDLLPNERGDGPRPVVLYALSLLWRTTAGQVYPFSTYAGWLRDAGYEAIERCELAASPPLSLITARRPAC